MNRALHKAQRPDGGEWVTGYYVCLNGIEHRLYGGYAETDCGSYFPDYDRIIPETLRACTGKRDRNGKSIYEGNLCRFTADDEREDYVVLWDGDVAGYKVWVAHKGRVENNVLPDDLDTFFCENCEVIGVWFTDDSEKEV